ncbi:ANTAR domain-containing response regulator [Vibrio brasiliensis]|uniref:Putative two-component response regulatory protein n=1 Tax=Vibrio brasiliensis LMG 20546 TaxID=945543 RepID=E8LU39_9VIBR|nr:ANTAR domain-containing protein [Vibrio brasiliensis]EGA65792.1 putative two-component response regulatory protein [Vibrio brasiliensis LMG 20546]
MKAKLSQNPIVICCDRLEQQVKLTTQLAQEYDEISTCQLSQFEVMIEREPDACVVIGWQSICAELCLMIDVCRKRNTPLLIVLEKINVNDINRLPKQVDYVVIASDWQSTLSPWLQQAQNLRSSVVKLEQKIDGLETRLEDRKLIEKAKGMLMKLHQVDEQQAYQAMRKSAMQSSQPLGQVARNLLQTLEALK